MAKYITRDENGAIQVKTVTPENGEYFTTEELNELVIGHLEFVYFQDGSQRIMCINEEGKLLGMWFNYLATDLAHSWCHLSRLDVIVGPAVILEHNEVR